MKEKRLLIVEDSKTQLLFLQMAFEKEGYDVITAEDGLEGVSRAFLDNPDLIVSDIMMPELSGYQLCRLLKNDERVANIPIILLTSLDQPQDKFWGIRAGAEKYLVKSSDFSLLREAVKILLKKTKNSTVSKKKTPVDQKSLSWQSINSNLNQLLDKMLFESILSNEAKRLARSISNPDNLIKEVAVLVNSLIDYSCLSICLLDNNEAKLYYDIKHPLPEIEIQKVTDHLLSTVGFKPEKDDIEISFLQDSPEKNNTATSQIMSRLMIPLKIHEGCLGYLSIYSIKESAFSYESENILHLLVNDFSMVFKLMQLYGEVKRLSITDGLTKLYNKQYFQEVFEKEFERSKRYNKNLSLIMIDIDHFKFFNDTYGHLQGDSVLSETGAILKKSVRSIDFVARYGGEEFIILTFDTGLDSAVSLAEKVRKNIENHGFKAEKGSLKVMVSMGVATMTDEVRNKFDLIKKADKALYRAKKEGRNRVCIEK